MERIKGFSTMMLEFSVVLIFLFLASCDSTNNPSPPNNLSITTSPSSTGIPTLPTPERAQTIVAQDVTLIPTHPTTQWKTATTQPLDLLELSTIDRNSIPRISELHRYSILNPYYDAGPPLMAVHQRSNDELLLLSISIGRSSISNVLRGVVFHNLDIDPGIYYIVRYSGDLTKYALMTNEGEISVFNVDDDSLIASSNSFFISPRHYSFSPSGEKIAILFGEKRQLVIWDYQDDEVSHIYSCGENVCNFSWKGEDSEIEVSDYFAGVTYFISTLEESRINHFQGIISTRTSDGRYFAGKSNPESITIWNQSDWSVHSEITQIDDIVEYPVSFSSDSQYLVITNQAQGLVIWDVLSREVIAEIDGYYFELLPRWVTNEPIVFFMSSWDSIVAYDVEAGEEIREFHIPDLCDYLLTEKLLLVQTCNRSTTLIVYGVP